MSDIETKGIDPHKLLVDLVRCPSVTPETAGTLDLLEAFLTPLGFVCTRLTFEGDGSYPVDNLFATRDRGGKHLLFGGHTDVVPTGDESLWTHKPFAGDTIDGILWGRGAVDMKSGVAAFCMAAAQAIADGSADNGTISLAITNDEEADSINGTEKLLQWTKAEGHVFDFAIVGEPSSASQVGDRIKIGRRGSYDGLVEVTGQQGHVAYPEQAKNPVPPIARIATQLSAEPLDDGSAHFQPSNLEVTTLDVGNGATNVIPQSARLLFNVRFNDHWDATKLGHWVRAQIAAVDHQGCEVAFSQPSPASPGFICKPGDEVALLGEVITQTTGHTPAHSTNGGTSDARFIAQYCPVVECGLVGAHMHAIDERVPLADVETLTQIYSGFMQRYFTA